MSHALFSPSAAHRWMACPGSFAYPGNTEDGGSSKYADDGTASHEWASKALIAERDAYSYIGETQEINGRTYEMDEERADFIQTYLNTVHLQSLGRVLLVEHHVDLSRWLGPDQGGTADAAIIGEDEICIIDLKYGMGERVEAAYIDERGKRKPNHQLGLYAAGILQDAALYGYSPMKCRLIVSQPRIGNHSEEVFEFGEIIEHAIKAGDASKLAGTALILDPNGEQAQKLMHPGEKQCRWCCAKATCPKLAAAVVAETRSDFEDQPNMPAPGLDNLSKAVRAVPLIQLWCSAVMAEAAAEILEGHEVIGADGLPMKFVEGKLGKRAYLDKDAAEATLVGLLGPDAYAPQQIITAAAAYKKFNKAKTKATLTDVIEPLIHRPTGKPVLALGSDPRAPHTGGNIADDFTDEDE
jgi:hypothetical protein